MPAPARYFPVRETPYRMKAGLQPLGTDFGNGARDRLYFQRDDEGPRYLHARRAVSPARSGILARTGGQRAAHAAVLAWLWSTWRNEHRRHPLPERTGDDASDYAALLSLAQEDLTVLHRDGGGRESAIAVYVDFPSGWRPERVLGASFATIHRPVPGFANDEAQVRSMTSSMIDRGPYVRFVWTLSADDALDHHPEEGGRRSWHGAERAWLRVERQVLVPFPSVAASLFLIRTYLYAFETLSKEQRRTLRAACAAMPDEIARYKGLAGEPRTIAQRLLMD